MQRIFDVDNKEDMDLLWSILPTNTNKITGHNDNTTYLFEKEHQCFASICPDIIRINWHDKTEITRPVNYEDMIGCVCWFEDGDNGEKTLDILTGFNPDDPWCFETASGSAFSKFTPAKKSELKFYGEQDE